MQSEYKHNKIKIGSLSNLNNLHKTRQKKISDRYFRWIAKNYQRNFKK